MTVNSPRTPNEFVNTLFILSGSTILACGVAFFLLPGEIATGGTPGMGMLVHFMTDISTGMSMLLVNIPLLIAGVKFIDGKFAARTVLSMVTSAVMVDLLARYANFPQINSNLLSTLYGGTCVGAGVGLVLKGQASAGGTTIIAKIVSTYSHIKPAQVVLLIDALIVIAAGIILKDMEKVLWAMLSIYVTTQVIDKVLTLAVPEKIVHIVSDKAEEIGIAVDERLERDGTIISGQNLITQKDKKLLFVVVGARRIPQLKNIVLSIDPDALMIVMEAQEMMGSSRRFRD